MKVQKLTLKNFKRFEDTTFDFTDPETGLARDLIVLAGMNGSGKSSVLQAIAVMLGNAVNRLHAVTELNWPGFNFQLVSAHWRRQAEIDLSVEFSLKEITATADYCSQLKDGPQLLQPSQNRLINLKLSRNKAWAASNEQIFQFRGREYAKQLVRFHKDGYRLFESVGTILWYTEQRTSTSLTPEDYKSHIEFNDDLLRDRLAKFAMFHRELEDQKIIPKPGQKDLYQELEKAYQIVFPDRSFHGLQLRDSVDEVMQTPWFNFHDGKRTYEISEMSGGERAIFPILFDFVNWNLHNSVILIDEIELHLHPPMQQALLGALGKLGQNNQFIITSHSDYIADIVPESAIIRMEGEV